MYNKRLIKLVTAALMAALTCAATYAIHIPSPAGYIHPGDGFVLLSGIILGPIYGSLAGGIGSLLADLIAGYPQYALATLLIKALTAALAAFIYRKERIVSVILAGVLGSLIVTPGYFIYDSFLYGAAVALEQAPLNAIQNLLGIAVSTLLFPLVIRIPQIRDIMKK